MKVQRFHKQNLDKPGPPMRLNEWIKAATEDHLLEDYEEDDLPIRNTGNTRMRRGHNNI